MASFTHKGVEITFNERSATFSCTVNEKRESAPSLSAIQKKIDKLLDAAFEPFTALRQKRYGDPKGSPDLVAVKIIRKDKDGRGRYERGGFVDDEGRKYRSRELLPDTREARDLYEAYSKAVKASEKAEEAKRIAQEALPWMMFTD